MFLEEGNKEVQNLIDFLESKIKELKQNKKLAKSDQKYLIEYYNEVIVPLTEKFYFSKEYEISKKDESDITNSILDVVNKLKKL